MSWIKFDKDRFKRDMTPDKPTLRNSATRLFALDEVGKLSRLAKKKATEPFRILSKSGKLFFRKPDDGFYAKGSTPNERFMNMCDHYEMSEQGIQKRLKDTSTAFNLNAIVAAGAIVVAVIFPAFSMFTLVFAALFALKAFAACAVHYQFRKREVVPLMAFIRSGDILPK